MDDRQKTITARIALVSFSSLGDGLVYYMLAENLRQHGYDITLYGDIAYQLRDWMPHLKVRPYPVDGKFDVAMSQYHHVIMSPPNSLRRVLSGEYLEQAKRKWLLLCQKAPQAWCYDHLIQDLKQKLPASVFSQLEPMLACGSSIRFRKFPRGSSLVDVCVAFMRERLGLQHATRDVSLHAPEHLIYRRHPQRVVISPDSAWPEKKDWMPSSFVKTARLLQAHGYQPVFTVAPLNHQRWDEILQGEFMHAKFSNINELASFIYESGALICNDSGSGHLASILRVPVVTVYRKRNREFLWRPSWGKGIVVTPRFVLPWLGEDIWRPFIRPVDVLRALQELIQKK
ncbi:hypothetical protein LG198_12700 [Methylobacillus arboreus]|uniref:glycosyltransferase family 9 protein n=1 Tax=Methylobacillus arboreus TaxID=755170 RepID=UPI001E3056C7|nr:glycosyltransferase family 9 protein [Methylobacillus arboreus]MCB5191589.1 hypothetical protein [Methylobacillus arboreus]